MKNEIKNKTSDLIDKIRIALVAFTKETGLKVSRIHVGAIEDGDPVLNYSVNVRIEI